VIFICEKHLKRFRQLRNISGFLPGKFQKVSRTILAPSKNYQACAGTNLTLWYPLKQLFSFTETHQKRFRQLRNISGFHPGKFQKVSRTILAPSKNYQACAETNLTLWYPLKQLFSFTGTIPISSPERFCFVRNFFGEFLSDSPSSIQQIDDP